MRTAISPGQWQPWAAAVADPDLELRGRPGLVLLAFFPSVISSFFTQKKGGGGPPGPLPWIRH